MLLRLGDFGDCSALDFGERELGDALTGVFGDIRGDFGERGDLLSDLVAVRGNTKHGHTITKTDLSLGQVIFLPRYSYTTCLYCTLCCLSTRLLILQRLFSVGGYG